MSGIIFSVNNKGMNQPPVFWTASPPAITNPATPVPSGVWPSPVSGSAITINEMTALTECQSTSWAEIVFQVYQTSKIVPSSPGLGLVAFFDHTYQSQGMQRMVKTFNPAFVLPAGDTLTIYSGCYSASAYGASFWLTWNGSP